MKKLDEDKKEEFVDAVVHLYLQHKRLYTHVEILTLAVETEQWQDMTVIYDSLKDYNKIHYQIGPRLRRLVEMIEEE